MLLVENNARLSFNSTNAFDQLFKQYPSSAMTLDLGHTAFVGADSYKKFIFPQCPP